MTAPEKRKSLDWEAIERDYRVDTFTLRELADKHDTNAATISRRIKQDREKDPSRWQKDLTKVVRQATNAKLMAALVNNEVNKGQQEVNNVIQAAAEVNSAVILRHREDLKSTRDLAMDMLHELKLATHSPQELEALFALATQGLDAASVASVQQSFRDMLRLHNRVQSINKLADTLSKVQTLDRQAFNLDAPDPGGGEADRPMPDTELASKLAYVVDLGRRRLAGG
jgi:hypothetical protein